MVARITAAIEESARRSIRAGNALLQHYRNNGIDAPGTFTIGDDQAADREAGIDGWYRSGRPGHPLIPVGYRWQHGRIESTITVRDTGPRGELAKRRHAQRHYPTMLMLHSYWYPNDGTWDVTWLALAADVINNIERRQQINYDDRTPFRFARLETIGWDKVMSHSRWDRPTGTNQPDTGQMQRQVRYLLAT